MSCRIACLALPLCALLAPPASALTIAFTTAPGSTLTAGQEAALETAAAAWQSVLTDPVAVSVEVNFTGQLPAGVLASTLSALTLVDYGAFKGEYAADARSAADHAALAHLPATVRNGQVVATTVEAKALGGPATAGLDGSISFSTAFPFAETRAALNRYNYDLIGIAEHEIGHLLGFTSMVDNTSDAYVAVVDLFRYASPGVWSFRDGEDGYFSLDGGATGIAGFSTGFHSATADGYEASHWKQGTLSGGLYALLDPTSGLGQQKDISPLDLLALDVLGYDVAVPEPSTVLLLGSAVLGLTGLRRRAA